MLKIKGKNSKDIVFFGVRECTGKPAWYSNLCLERRFRGTIKKLQ